MRITHMTLQGLHVSSSLDVIPLLMMTDWAYLTIVGGRSLTDKPHYKTLRTAVDGFVNNSIETFADPLIGTAY